MLQNAREVHGTAAAGTPVRRPDRSPGLRRPHPALLPPAAHLAAAAPPARALQPAGVPVNQRARYAAVLESRAATLAAVDAPPCPVIPEHRPGNLTSPIEQAVLRAIELMNQDLECPRGIIGIAEQTHYSKFHFSREFHRITGTSPRRYLRAIRMARAKELLVETTLGIAEISHLIGYSSVGTFSSRFCALVGMPPSEWRQGEGTSWVTPAVPLVRGSARCTVTVTGYTDAHQGVVVGAFCDSVIQGDPAARSVLRDAGATHLTGLPAGTWTIVARGVPADRAGHPDTPGTAAPPEGATSAPEPGRFERPHLAWSATERSRAERSHTGWPRTGWSRADRSPAEGAAADRPGSDRPGTDRPGTDRSGHESVGFVRHRFGAGTSTHLTIDLRRVRPGDPPVLRAGFLNLA